MLQKFFAFLLYRIMGWRLEGSIPHEQDKLLVIYLPHTSNWDFVIGWLFIKAEHLDITIFGKDAFNFFPLKYGYSLFGVVPIKRGKRANFVQQAVTLYQSRDRLWTAMAPEGTRSYMNHLKSGYYYLARDADVPLLVVGPNFQQKTITVQPLRHVFTSFDDDAANLMQFSKLMRARKPGRSFRHDQ